MIPKTLTEQFAQAKALEALRLHSLELLEDIAHWNLVSQTRALEEELRECGTKAGFNPGQPRAPLGSPTGGQWVSGGGDSGSAFVGTSPKTPGGSRGGTDLGEVLLREVLQRVLGEKLPKLPKLPDGILNFSEGDSTPEMNSNAVGIARILLAPAILQRLYGVFRTAVATVEEIISLSNIFGDDEGSPQSPDPSGGGDSPDSGEGPGKDPRKRPEGVPDHWVETPSDKQGGIKYTDPGSKSGNEVRVMPGNPDSPFPNSRGPNVRWTRNGQTLDVNGSPVPKKSPDAHIPLKDFEFNIKIYKKLRGFYV